MYHSDRRVASVGMEDTRAMRPDLIWMAGGDPASPLAQALAQGGASRVLPADEPLWPLLARTPAAWRPGAVVLAAPPADGEDPSGLPCHALAWGFDPPGIDQRLADDPATAAAQARALAQRGRRWPALDWVQVNLPLGDLLGRHRDLALSLPINLEVGLDGAALDRVGATGLAEARSILGARPRRVTVHLPFFDLHPGSSDPLVRQTSQQRLAQAAQAALELGAISAVAHSGYVPLVHAQPHEYRRRAAPVLTEVAAILAGGGCRLCLENVFETTPDQLLELGALVDRPEAPVWYCLDGGHALTFSQRHPAQWLEALGPRLGEVHLHDNQGHGDLHLPPGRGQVGWDALWPGLLALDPPPVLTLEPHREPDFWASLRWLEGRPEPTACYTGSTIHRACRRSPDWPA